LRPTAGEKCIAERPVAAQNAWDRLEQKPWRADAKGDDLGEKLKQPELSAFSERVDAKRVPAPGSLLIERHQPRLFQTPYHHHTSVEINFLQDCTLGYSFSGQKVSVDPERLTLFWGAAPHRVVNVRGNGQTTNIYISLGQFLRWSLPVKLVEAVLSGCVISAQVNGGHDRLLMDRLFTERERDEANWRKLHLSELECRLRRMGHEGWDVLLSEAAADRRMLSSSASMLHVEGMLRYIAENFFRPVTVVDVVGAVNLSQGHAMKLFRQVIGLSIKEQLTRTRLSHALMLLSDTDEKILTIALDSGFRSLSSFYEAFSVAKGQSPGRYRAEMQALA